MAKGTHSYLEDDRNKSIKIYVNGKILSKNIENGEKDSCYDKISSRNHDSW